MAMRDFDPLWDRKTYISIKENFKELFNYYIKSGLDAAEARQKAHDAVMKSGEALALSERTQKELSQAILKGDSSPLGGQLSVGADGTVYNDPQDRFVNEFNSINQKLTQKADQNELNSTKDQLTKVTSIATDAKAKADNPLMALSAAGYKIPLSDLSNEVIDAMTGTTGITTAKGYFENNRGVDFPLKSVIFNGSLQPVGERTKNVVLDAKVFGAKMDKYYRLTYISNGREEGGRERWGISLREYDKSTFATTDQNYKNIFAYNSDTLPGNEGNANWERQEGDIETITVDNGEIAVSVTVDRSVIDRGEAGFTTHLSVHTDSPTAIIDPANYFF